MIPDTYEYPPQQKKTAAVRETLKKLAASKTEQEQIARKIAENTGDAEERRMADAFALSNRKMAEDIYRETGYMLPQSRNTHEFLKSLLEQDMGEGFPEDAVKELLELLPVND